MVCSCCGTKKKLFDMFYSVEAESGKLDLCRDCWDVVERLESDLAGGEKELYDLHLIQLQKRSKNPSESFLTWKMAHFPSK